MDWISTAERGRDRRGSETANISGTVVKSSSWPCPLWLRHCSVQQTHECSHTGHGCTFMEEATLIHSPPLLDFYFKKCKISGICCGLFDPRVHQYNAKYIYSKFRPLNVNIVPIFPSSQTFLPSNQRVGHRSCSKRWKPSHCSRPH